MNVNLYVIEDYKNETAFRLRKNKPNSNPISERPKMSANVYVIEDYENEPLSGPKKQTQTKPISVPLVLFIVYNSMKVKIDKEFCL